MNTKISEIIPILFFISFGVWLALFPNSVIRFYSWFHSEKIKLPSPNIIRMVGILWAIFVIVISLFSK